MLPDLNDTIVALSSAPGPGGRAIVRLSGPDAVRIAASVFEGTEPLRSSERRLYAGTIALPELAPLLADCYVWPAPRSYTGQQLAELHTLSSPPLLDLIVAQLLGAGARAAERGEFTQRAFLAGKLDLTRAEAVLGIIEAGNRDELKHALAQLAGGVGKPLQTLRSDLLDLLADVEAGLDFAEEDVQFVDTAELLKRITRGMALVTLLQKQLNQRALGGRAFRVVLAGRPNSGKSSLFNALLGRPAALVSAEAGTTRDYLVGRLHADGATIELVDTAGREFSPSPPPRCPRHSPEGATGEMIEEQAQRLGHEQSASADLVLWCHPTDWDWPDQAAQVSAEVAMIAVATKCDLGNAARELLATSAVRGEGLRELRELLEEKARNRPAPALAPSLSRCRNHVQRCLDRLRHAHAVVLFEEPTEVLAIELRGALEELGEMVGAVYTEDLLDRIFSRFCIGK
jgi:tRNA modification GTPase